jgi:hypothetical protein
MWSAFGSIAAALAAVVAAVLIVRQISQARQLNEEQARAYVTVWVAEDPETRSTIELHIKNAGLTVARDVHIHFDRPHELTRPTPEYSFMDARVFTKGIATMPPGFEIKMTMDLVKDRADAPEETQIITATVTFRDVMGKLQRDEYTLDLHQMQGALRLETHGLHHIAKSVRAIAKKMGATSF